MSRSVPAEATDRAAALARLITETRNTLEELARILDAEREALGRADARAIEEAATAKAGLADRLDRLEDERRALAGDVEPSAFPKLLDRVDPSGRLRGDWGQAMEAAAACRRGNEINARIVEASRQRLEAALALLRGGTETYGPDGRRGTPGGAGPLAKA